MFISLLINETVNVAINVTDNQADNVAISVTNNETNNVISNDIANEREHRNDYISTDNKYQLRKLHSTPTAEIFLEGCTNMYSSEVSAV